MTEEYVGCNRGRSEMMDGKRVLGKSNDLYDPSLGEMRAETT